MTCVSLPRNCRPSHYKSLPVTVSTMGRLCAYALAPTALAPLQSPIPRHRRTQPLHERMLRRPSELRADLRSVNRIAAIVAKPILHIRDQRFGFVQYLQYQARDVDVSPLVVAAHVVHLADSPRVQNHVHRPAVILDMQPVAHIFPVAVDRERLTPQSPRDKVRNQLFRILIRPVVVRAARDQGRKTVCLVIRAPSNQRSLYSLNTASWAQAASPP